MINRELLRERLEKAYLYLKGKGLIHSKSDLARTVGIRINNLNDAFGLRGNYMNESLLNRIADAFPDVLNRTYLLTGEGDVAAPDRMMKPHFPATVEAGLLSGDLAQVMDYDVEMEPVIRKFPDYDYMIDVSGQSMEPTYYDGDSVACRNVYDRNEIMPGKVYVFVTREGAVLKRFVSSTLSTIRVASDNPEFKPYNIDSDSLLAIAEVVGSVRSSRPDGQQLQDALLNFARRIIASRSETLSEEQREELIKAVLGKRP